MKRLITEAAPTADSPWWLRLLHWQPDRLRLWQRLGVALLITLAALWLRQGLAPAESGGRFITFSLAAALSALYGGFAAGLFSTLLGMVLVNFLFVHPYFQLAITNPAEAFWLNTWFLVTQLVVIGAIWRMQAQNRQLQESNQHIRDSQQHFLDTFEHAAAGITHVGFDGQFQRVNGTFCRLVGYSFEELRQMRFQDLTHPDDIGPDEVLIKQVLAGERSSYSLEKRYRRKDGRTVWAHLTVSMVRKPNGLPDYLISVVQDITSLKAAEETVRTNERLLRQAQALSGFASWEADIKGDRIRAHHNSHQRLGLPKGEYTSTELLDIVHPRDRDRFAAEWRAALKSTLFNGNYRVRIDGKDRWVGIRAEFERNADGHAVRAFAVAQDITDRKRAEIEIRRLNASLEQRIQERTRKLRAAYDELESYSYAVAHDLRSPLRVINGFAQALEEDNPALDAVSHKHLARIMGASKKMGELIDGLLQLAQIGRSDLRREPVNISQVSTRLLEDLALQTPERRVDWRVDPHLQAQADPALVEALLQNLLHNAWKYTSQTPEARIRVYEDIVDGQPFYCVSDNGAGFDMKRAEKLFQPFQRLHQPHEFAGLGIGLATAQRIVQRHGGVMTAVSTPGQGATFRFTLRDEDNESLPSVPPSI